MSSYGITVDKVTVTFSREQIDWLNAIAERRSTSFSDIIRRLIDETRGAYLTPRKARLARLAVQTSSDNATT
jgi:predicted CopG family antitoxin